MNSENFWAAVRPPLSTGGKWYLAAAESYPRILLKLNSAGSRLANPVGVVVSIFHVKGDKAIWEEDRKQEIVRNWQGVIVTNDGASFAKTDSKGPFAKSLTAKKQKELATLLKEFIADD